jgi:hypothetical protein
MSHKRTLRFAAIIVCLCMALINVSPKAGLACAALKMFQPTHASCCCAACAYQNPQVSSSSGPMTVVEGKPDETPEPAEDSSNECNCPICRSLCFAVEPYLTVLRPVGDPLSFEGSHFCRPTCDFYASVFKPPQL